MKKQNVLISYTYDQLNRLAAAEYNGEKAVYYHYDVAGNLTAVGPDKGETEKVTANDFFTVLEKEYQQLSELFQAGSLSTDQYREEINRLRLQDADKIWWQLSYNGVWLKWDGSAWLEGYRKSGIVCPYQVKQAT